MRRMRMSNIKNTKEQSKRNIMKEKHEEHRQVTQRSCTKSMDKQCRNPSFGLAIKARVCKGGG